MDIEKITYFLVLCTITLLGYYLKRKSEMKHKKSNAVHGKHKLEKKDWTGLDE